MGFDAAITGSNGAIFCINNNNNGTDYLKTHMATNNRADYMPLLYLTCSGSTAGEWIINGVETQNVTLTVGTWYSFLIHVADDNVTLTITPKKSGETAVYDGEVTGGTISKGVSTIQYQANSTTAVLDIDNIAVYTY